MKFWKRKPEIKDPVYQSYANLFQSNLYSKTPIRDISFCVLDTETTGLNPRKDQILSIAVIKVIDMEIRVEDRLTYYIQADQYQPGTSVQIHGILKKHLHEGETEKNMLDQLIQFLGNDVIVGHHIGFDIKILDQAFKRQYGGKILNKSLDTRALAQKLDPMSFYQNSQKAGNLDQLCENFNIPLGNRHTAEGDTFITALLFLKLMGRLDQKGLKYWRDL